MRKARARQAARANRAKPTPKPTVPRKPAKTHKPTQGATQPRKKASVEKRASRQAAPPRPSRTYSRPATHGRSVAAVIAYAKAQLGDPYVFGAAGPDSFDCSGLVMSAYRRIGISLPHQTGGLLRRGRAVGQGQLRPGDLVFPESGHVGIYLGGGRMIHAPRPGTSVKISTVYDFYAGRRIVGN